MNKEEWSRWRSLPETAKYFKFLEEYRLNVGKEVGTAIAEGQFFPEEVTKEISIRCQSWVDIETLEWTDIENFYGEENDASKHTG